MIDLKPKAKDIRSKRSWKKWPEVEAARNEIRSYLLLEGDVWIDSMKLKDEEEGEEEEEEWLEKGSHSTPHLPANEKL